jgi:hypothetical protein|tara:strand:- start:176 stop:361 length:186 start_codon:yes stop_codon:yes gene_type:complete
MVSELVSWRCTNENCKKQGGWALLKINGDFWFRKNPPGRTTGHCNCGQKLGEIPKKLESLT